MTKEEIINKLLTYFLSEAGYDSSIPEDYDIAKKRRLLRGLINERNPKEISEDILKLEDELLKQEFQEKKITDCMDISEVEPKISIWQGDITTLKIDAIVNAANEYGLGCFIPNHSCIDNAIHTFAGIRLRLECNNILKGKLINTGESIITPAYNLPSKYVIHTVGPIVNNELTDKEIEDLKRCYVSCLNLARENNIKTIAFSAISTGVFRFPKDVASKIAVSVVRNYISKYPSAFTKVIFNVFSNEDYEYYARLF